MRYLLRNYFSEIDEMTSFPTDNISKSTFVNPICNSRSTPRTGVVIEVNTFLRTDTVKVLFMQTSTDAIKKKANIKNCNENVYPDECKILRIYRDRPQKILLKWKKLINWKIRMISYVRDKLWFAGFPWLWAFRVNSFFFVVIIWFIFIFKKPMCLI